MFYVAVTGVSFFIDPSQPSSLASFDYPTEPAKLWGVGAVATNWRAYVDAEKARRVLRCLAHHDSAARANRILQMTRPQPRPYGSSALWHTTREPGAYYFFTCKVTTGVGLFSKGPGGRYLTPDGRAPTAEIRYASRPSQRSCGWFDLPVLPPLLLDAKGSFLSTLEALDLAGV